MLHMLKKTVSFFYFLIAALSVCSFASAQITPSTAEERMKSVEQRLALEKKSIVNDVKFRSIGPSIMSGRVVDVDANPDDPTEF
jgi:hypothetical protein